MKISRLFRPQIRRIAILATIGPALSLVAFGADSESTLSAAGGISAPSYATALFQNPAGLTYNNRLRLSAHGLSNERDLSSGSLGASALYGKSSFGLGAGARYNSPDDSLDARFGLGVNAQSIKTRFGVSGNARITPSGGDPSWNAGILMQPRGDLTLGATAFALEDGVSEWGLGAALSIASQASLVTDLTIDPDAEASALQPALRVGDASAALTVGYGFKLSGNGFASRQVREGFSAGASVAGGSSTRIEFYYNQLARYFTAISFDF